MQINDDENQFSIGVQAFKSAIELWAIIQPENGAPIQTSFAQLGIPGGEIARSAKDEADRQMFGFELSPERQSDVADLTARAWFVEAIENRYGVGCVFKIFDGDGEFCIGSDQVNQFRASV